MKTNLIESFTADERAGLAITMCLLAEIFPNHDIWDGVLAGGIQIIIFGSKKESLRRPAFAVYQKGKDNPGPSFGLRFDDKKLRARITDTLGGSAYTQQFPLTKIAIDSTPLQFYLRILSETTVIPEIAQRMEGSSNNELKLEKLDDTTRQWLQDTLSLTKHRRGQAEFRKHLIKIFETKCAISNCAVEPALEACHINPHHQSINYSMTNGLLLRSDLHRLFDAGMLAIDGEYRVHIRHPANLDPNYLKLHGTLIRKPNLDQQSLGLFKNALAARFISGQ